MSPAYVVSTIGELGGCGCSGAIGAVHGHIDPQEDWIGSRIDDARRGILPWLLPWWVNAIVGDDPSLPSLPNLPSLPKAPDPIPPALDVAGPAGWGPYVLPSCLAIAALGAAAFLLTRRNHT